MSEDLFYATATGRYYKVYKDGVYVSQHSTEREATQKCYNLLFYFPRANIRYNHEYEVEVGLTDAGITEAQDYTPAPDVAPVIASTPTPPNFLKNGVVQTYDMSQHITDDGVSAVTYTINNPLPNGVSFNSSTGILTYDGVETPTTSSHTLEAQDAVGSSGNSASFDIVVLWVTIDTISDVSNLAIDGTSNLWQYVNDPNAQASSSTIVGLDTNVATWDHATGLLTGVTADTMTGLILRVSYLTETIDSNTFSVTVQEAVDGNLTWTAPPTLANGDALSGEITGYKVYKDTGSGFALDGTTTSTGYTISLNTGDRVAVATMWSDGQSPLSFPVEVE